MKGSSSFEEFQEKLFLKYGISVHESRGQISYIMPDRTKPIRGKSLSTNFEKQAIMIFFVARNKALKLAKNRAAQSGEKSRSATGKSIRLITDVEACVKAQQSRAYAQKVKVGNLQQMSQTLIFLQDNGIGTMEELQSMLSSTREDFKEKSSRLKATESEFRDANRIIHATGQYLSTRGVHAEYLKAKDKKKFRSKHESDLIIYDAAIKELKEYYGEEKFASMKSLKAKRTQLIAAKNEQYEDFCYSRSRQRELQTIDANVRSILDLKDAPEQDQTQNRG